MCNYNYPYSSAELRRTQLEVIPITSVDITWASSDTSPTRYISIKTTASGTVESRIRDLRLNGKHFENYKQP